MSDGRGEPAATPDHQVSYPRPPDEGAPLTLREQLGPSYRSVEDRAHTRAATSVFMRRLVEARLAVHRTRAAYEVAEGACQQVEAQFEQHLADLEACAASDEADAQAQVTQALGEVPTHIGNLRVK